MFYASCNCGAVKAAVDAPLIGPDACHCGKCRKFSGHYWASVDVPKDAVTFTGADAITWYQSSDKVERGFCGTCGSAMFFRPIFRDWIAIAMGAIDGPSGATLCKHIFVGDKGDYYQINDGLPQNLQ